MRKVLLALAMLLVSASWLYAQEHTINGRVTGEDGSPLPGITVQVKGTNTGTATDASGHFKLTVPANSTLIFRGVGFQQTTLTTGSRSNLTVMLASNTKQLNELVVTALGIQKQEKELGYSTAKVTGSSVVQAKPISVANGLTGKVSGLQVNTVNNGLFAPTRITLRGNRSLTGNNQPLIVVDGAIFYNDISTINPDDILDVNILKGSSASAVYGSDASNGVIIITTKKGIAGKPTINFSSTVQMETVAYMPALQTRFGSNGGEKWINDFMDLSGAIPYENQAYGPEFHPGGKVPIGRPAADGSHQSIPYMPVANQKRDFFDQALTTQNNVSYSAGDDRGKFFMSAQDVNSKAVMPGDKGKRDAFRVAGSKTYGIFSGDFTLSYTRTNTDKTSNEAGVYDDMLNTPADIPLPSLRDWQHNKWAGLDGYYNDYYLPPYWVLGNDRSLETDDNIAGNMHLNLKPTSWLNLSYRLSLDNAAKRYEIKNADINYSNYSLTSSTVLYSNYYGTGVDTAYESPKFAAASANGTQANYQTWTTSNYLVTSDFVATINKDITKDLNLNVNLGTSYIDNKINSVYINAGNLFFPVYNVSSLTGIPSVGSGTAEARKLGYFGEAQFGYKGFAFLHGSYRTDIDSRLSKSNRFIPYYDVDASLVLSDMIRSLSQSKVLNYLKVRAAHSLTGNVSALGNGSAYIADGAYKTVPTLYAAGGFPFNGLGGFLLNSGIANPNIKPEIVYEDEVGLEMGFFENRASLTLAVYKSSLKDGIVNAPIPTSSGFTNALVNAANTENKGVEADLHANIIRSRDWSWNVDINYTYAHSKVVSINGNQKSLGIPGNNGNSYAVVGYSYPVIETWDWVRDPQGHVIVDPTTGLPSKAANLSILGQATPKDILGISTSLTYKNFTFSATADYRGGYKIFNAMGENLDFTGNGLTSTLTGRQHFVFPNSVIPDPKNPGGYITNTNVITDDANFNFWPSLYNSVGANYVVSAAAWKLREVALTYTLPYKWFAPTKVIQNASITVSGRNLLMLRPSTNKWTDPEFNEDTGNDIGRTGEGQAPPTRIYSATLDLQF